MKRLDYLCASIEYFIQRFAAAYMPLGLAYDVIGADPSISDADLVRIYKRQVLSNHPDRAAEEDKSEATRIMTEINLAYESIKYHREHGIDMQVPSWTRGQETREPYTPDWAREQETREPYTPDWAAGADDDDDDDDVSLNRSRGEMSFAPFDFGYYSVSVQAGRSPYTRWYSNPDGVLNNLSDYESMEVGILDPYGLIKFWERDSADGGYKFKAAPALWLDICLLRK